MIEFTQQEKRERQRPQILLNLLPQDVAANQQNQIYHPIYTYYYDREQYNLDKFKFTLPKRDQMKRFAGQINMLKKKESSFLHPEAELMEINQSGHPIDFQPFSVSQTGLYSSGCVSCGKQNLEIPGYGERHVCLNCRQNLRTYEQDPVSIFLDQKNRLMCLGIQLDQDGQKVYYKVNYDKIKIFQHRCQAVVTEQNQLVILLHDQQDILNQFNQTYDIWNKRDPPKVDRTYKFYKKENQQQYHQNQVVMNLGKTEQTVSSSNDISSMEKSVSSSIGSQTIRLQKINESISSQSILKNSPEKLSPQQSSPQKYNSDKILVQNLINKELQFSFANIFNKENQNDQHIFIANGNKDISQSEKKLSKRAEVSLQYNSNLNIEQQQQMQEMQKEKQKALKQQEEQQQKLQEKRDLHILDKMTTLWKQ